MKITKKDKILALKTNYIKHGIYDISDIQRHHVGHWFDKDSMRFFRSKVCSDVFAGAENIYFISSEQFDHSSPRKFSVRVLNIKCRDIRTVGEFQGYETKATALTAALDMAFNEK